MEKERQWEENNGRKIMRDLARTLGGDVQESWHMEDERQEGEDKCGGTRRTSVLRHFDRVDTRIREGREICQ